MPKFILPKRAIHLDFHTGPDIPDVGRDFDPNTFARTFADAHVDSVTLFAKCHHGHLYYNTNHPARHPGLPRSLSLLEEQIAALRRYKIRTPLYVSVQCDEYAAKMHPEWIAIDPVSGQPVKWAAPLEAGWWILDMSSPYQEYLTDQIAEVCKKFAPIDWLFLDMCWDQQSISKWALDGMKRKGLDPRSAHDRGRYAREVARAYLARYRKMIDQAHKRGRPASIWFNSRPKMHLPVEKKFIRHVEIESLPTGGWGYTYFPYVSRFVRPYGLPALSHTARFHKSWADFGGLKPAAALKYECGLMLSQGMGSLVGDQLHPRGVLDKPAYELIGKVYRHIEVCGRWVDGGKIVSQIGVIINPEYGDNAGPDGLGIIRSLQQLNHQFDLVAPDADLDTYELVIIPESIVVTARLASRLRAFLKRGGACIVSGAAAHTAAGTPAMRELGIVLHGESPYSVTYLRAHRSIADGIEDMDHVMYERGFRMTPTKGATSLCKVVEPYFERSFDRYCSHRQTPPARVSRFAAVVQMRGVITFSVPVFTAYARHGNLVYRTLIGNAIRRLMPRPLVRAGGPSRLETTVVRKRKRTAVHLLSFAAERRAEDLDIVEDPIPLVDMPLAVRLDRKPRRVLLVPEEHELPFAYRDGYAEVSITMTGGHGVVVFEG
ncbi:MAG: hypothetical protein GF418_09380 [Chitinivibrionales bacterium]|nr:hypothetical protein [Chitinivibrionales bacterium]MBD3395820.1 hypothetical protein [Chitinivibrionales bacterium]